MDGDVQSSPQGAVNAEAERGGQMKDTMLKVSGAHFKVKTWKAEKTILDNVSFAAYSGELLALMGPSGAGKTTLMEYMTLSLRGGVLQGELTLNGLPLTLEVFKKRVSYVEQFDSHWAFLSCREVMEYAGALLIRGNASLRAGTVESTIVSMGLQECAGTRCGNEFLKGLSGGQKKRLALGVALLKDPAVLLLDEPTSGLDAAAAASVMGYLKDLSQTRGKIVIATIHQPSTQIFMSFSNVMFLANGRTAYHGRPSQVEGYCRTANHPLPPQTNPADHFIQLINSEFAGRGPVDELVEAWRQSGEAYHPGGQLTARSVAQSSRTGFLTQCRVLLSRHALLSVRDPTLYTGRAVAFLLSNAFFAVVYLEARDRSQEHAVNRVFFTNWMFAVVTLFSAVSVFTANIEYQMVKREMKNGMTSAAAYLLVTAILPLPYMLVLSASALVVPFYVIGNGNVEGIWLTILVLAATLWSYESSSQSLAVIAQNPLVGALGSISLWIVAFLFCGLFLQPEFVVWPLRLLTSVVPFTYTMRAMNYLEFHGTSWEGAEDAADGGFFCPNHPPIQCYGRTGDEVLTSLSRNFQLDSEDTVVMDIVCILLYGLFWKVLQLVVVTTKARYSFRAPSPSRGGEAPP